MVYSYDKTFFYNKINILIMRKCSVLGAFDEKKVQRFVIYLLDGYTWPSTLYVDL